MNTWSTEEERVLAENRLTEMGRKDRLEYAKRLNVPYIHKLSNIQLVEAVLDHLHDPIEVKGPFRFKESSEDTVI